MNIFKNTTVLLIALFLCFSCNDKDANDCFQKAGNIIKEEFVLADFEKIIVYNGIELYIQESDDEKIIVETGENLMPEIVLKVKNNQLEIIDNNKCNFVRDYNITKVYLYKKNITQIRNSSSAAVNSIGILNYPNLDLISENHQSSYLNSGDFNLMINTNNLSLLANGPSNHTISGTATNLRIHLAGSNPRFNGENLTAENAYLFARSTNDILLNINNEVSGNLYSTGDVVLFKKPSIINLNIYYTGKVIHNY